MRVKLDISYISDELYEAVLRELRAVHGNALFENWEISADKVENEELSTVPQSIQEIEE